MRQKNLDLIVAIALSILNMLWALLPSHLPIVGIILALPLVFWLPGYTLTQVLSYKRIFNASHHFALSIGLSVAIDTLSGFILNIFPGGLQAISWAIWLGLFTTGCSVIVVHLRQKIQIQQTLSWRISFTFSNVIMLTLAIVVAVLSVLYSALGVIGQPHKMFTQLWLLPANQARQTCAVQIGIQNFEATSTAYRIEMRIKGVLVHTWLPISLEPQQSWEQQVSFHSGTADNLLIAVQLYQLSNLHSIYRNVSLTIHVLKAKANDHTLHCTT